MGKKDDKIDELETENHALTQRIRELDDENRRLRGAPPVYGGGLTSASSRELVRAQEPEAYDGDGMPTALSPFERAAADDLKAIQELHRPPPAPERMETTLDVVRANNAERASLQGSAVRTNAILSRVASALRVDRWDEDGSELLAKCQQWNTFAHWLKQRQKSAQGAVANEIGTILTALVAPAQLAEWIMSKTADIVPEVALEVAETPDVPAHDFLGKPITRADFLGKPITRADLTWIRDAVAAYALDQRLLDPAPWLVAALKTERGGNELANILNLVLLPFLRRLRAVSETPLARGN